MRILQGLRVELDMAARAPVDVCCARIFTSGPPPTVPRLLLLLLQKINKIKKSNQRDKQNSYQLLVFWTLEGII